MVGVLNDEGSNTGESNVGDQISDTNDKRSNDERINVGADMIKSRSDKRRKISGD